VKILLDTHAWLWMLLEPERIGPKTRKLVASHDHAFFLSIASAWEMAIKHAAGRLTLPVPPLDYVRSRTREDGIALLPVSLEHVCRAAELPRHHADPFDRLLVAQTEIEDLVLLTHDTDIARYRITIRDPSA